MYLSHYSIQGSGVWAWRLTPTVALVLLILFPELTCPARVTTTPLQTAISFSMGGLDCSGIKFSYSWMRGCVDAWMRGCVDAWIIITTPVPRSEGLRNWPPQGGQYCHCAEMPTKRKGQQKAAPRSVV